MDKYKKITDLGLEVYGGIINSYVDANELLKVLDAGVEVYGQKYFDSNNSKNGWRVGENHSFQTHSALLINIKELKPKQVTITRADLDKALKKARQGCYVDLNQIAKELGL